MNNEEQIKVLRMVADGKITVEEGEKLLEVLENAAQSESTISGMPNDLMSDVEYDKKQLKMQKKLEKQYQKHLKRTQKIAEKQKYYDSDSTRIGEDRLSKAADELAQKAVDKALASIEKSVEEISNSILDK